jgi:16S rRNA C967 or C1407 C5-methylase (RsmB/RsmF family)
MAKRQKTTGEQAFREYYRKVFPEVEEFEQFLVCLKTPSRPALRFRLENESKLRHLWEQAGLSWRPLGWCQRAVEWPPEAQPGQILPGYPERLCYPMNASSLLPVLALDPQPGETILDACAAPGGKALFIFDQMGRRGRLIANDLSQSRRSAMQVIFKEYGAGEIETTRQAAETIFRRSPEAYDRILLDAPCSSEKHVFNSPTHLARWSPVRVRRLAQRQYGLLSGLLLALKPGGRLVYATCAVTPDENEAVVARFLEKKGDLVVLETISSELPGEGGLPIPTPREKRGLTAFNLQYVRRILPQHHDLDPMFVAVFRKLVQGPGTHSQPGSYDAGHVLVKN